MKANQGEDAAAGLIKSTQEAEYAVRGSIAVREQHKAKLRSLLSVIASHTWPVTTSGVQRPSIKLHSKQKKTRCTELKLPEIPEGKEIHVLGDLLLLTRAASVNVVENIQALRGVVYRGLPRPYIYENENYLLSMCEDLDFLDQVKDLVEWLGFRLLRNPFIVIEAMDDIITSRLGINVQSGRSLKYWCSASWRQNNKFIAGCQNAPELLDTKSTQSTKARWKKQLPPQSLVKPLESIQPEDDVVDGSRIAAAQEVLLKEESFHGRLLSLRVAREYVERGPSMFGYGDDNTDIASSSTVYDAIAVLNSQQKKSDYQAALLYLERVQVERTIQDLRNQVKWTELCRDCDHTRNHHVWQCRDKYRREVLEVYAKLDEKLHGCLATLSDEENRFGVALDKNKVLMSQLRLEQDNQRAARRAKQQQEEKARRAGIREKTVERSRIFRAKTNLARKFKEDKDPDRSPKFSMLKDSKNYHDVAMDIKSDIHLLEARKTNSPQSDAEDLDVVNSRLEEKRERSICLKRARLDQQARIVNESALILDHRRAENVAMKREDTLSRMVEMETNRRTRLQFQKARMDRLAACAMFKCMHDMNGKRFLLSVYSRNARGYDLEGLHIVAYDPSSSTTFTMEMPLREFSTLGYGRTSEGLRVFCKWFCLLYEKRRRQFRLVWSGSPCPPPLRIREGDQTLVCVHKEGVKMQHSPAKGYSVVAVYVRTDEPSTVRFVVSSWCGHENLLTEHAVAASDLVHDGDLDIQQEFSGHASIVWKHDLNASKPSNELHQPLDDTSVPLNCAIGPRIYSGEVVVDNAKHVVHIYNTNTTEYMMELVLKREMTNKHAAKPSQCPPVVNKLFLTKRDVNPYGVELPPSSFVDLLAMIHFEQRQVALGGGDGSSANDNNDSHVEWKATISAKWSTKLANYIRVLRLMKYACKISGNFCFVAIFIVQQKNEFRGHLLLEITWLSPTLSPSLSRGGVATRQSLQIALSDYLHCSNASRRLTVGLGPINSESEYESSCPVCHAVTESRPNSDDHLHRAPDILFGSLTSCSTCGTIQYWRLQAIKDLIAHAGAIAPNSLELVYHGYCNVCAAEVPAIVLVIGPTFSSRRWLLSLLERHFVSFDCSTIASLHPAEGNTYNPSFDEGSVTRENLLYALTEHRVVVLFNVNSGVTVSSANEFVHELHWWLYPDLEELPCHVAFAVCDTNPGRGGSDSNIIEAQRDYDLLEAIRALDHAVCQIAELVPVNLSDGDDKDADHASAFDAYLVAEAMLVEATRVLLHPEFAWPMPRKIVGASSWSTACDYLVDPNRLSTDLQRCNPLALQATTVEILRAYFSHAGWPRDYPNVRPAFYGLLNFMMRMDYMLRILDTKGGSLQGSSSRRHIVEGESAVEHESLGTNISVMDWSHLGNATDKLQSSHA